MRAATSLSLIFRNRPRGCGEHVKSGRLIWRGSLCSERRPHHIAHMRLPIPLHFITVVVCAAALVSPARTAVLGVRAINDPVVRADLELEHSLTPQRISLEVDAAISSGDLDLADSFAELARERGLALTSEQQ